MFGVTQMHHSMQILQICLHKLVRIEVDDILAIGPTQIRGFLHPTCFTEPRDAVLFLWRIYDLSL